MGDTRESPAAEVTRLVAAALPGTPVLTADPFLAAPPAGLASLANGARRLHDRGTSAWWLLLFMVLPMLLSLPGQLLKYSADEHAQFAGAALALLGLPFSIWGFVVMGCLQGTDGPNKFGADPLASQLQEGFA